MLREKLSLGQNPSRGAHETSGAAHIKESSDGSRNSARGTHFSPRVRLHEGGAAASDREHGRQGGAGREAQFFTEPTPCGGGRAQGRAERAGFQAQFFAEPRTGGGGGPQGRAKRARREAQLLPASGACGRSRTQGRTGEPRQRTLDLTRTDPSPEYHPERTSGDRA